MPPATIKLSQKQPRLEVSQSLVKGKHMSNIKELTLNLLGKFGVRVIREQYLRYLISLPNPSVMDLLARYQINCKNVLHIGGHFAEEASLYQENGIVCAVFIEGDPTIFPHLQAALREYPDFSCHLAMLSNIKGESEFYVASNEGASSSLLKPMRHVIERPDITFDERKSVQTTTLDSMKLGSYDLVVIDVQGAELLVMEGGADTIEQAKAIWIEVNAGSMYEGAANSSEIVEALSKSFVPLYMNMNENLWGDALFVRKSLL